MADEAEGQEEGKSSGGGLLPIINLVLLVLVLAVGGFVAWKMMAMDQTAQVETSPTQTEETKIPEAEEEDPSALPVYVDISDVTVNMADEDRDRFLRAKITLHVRNEEAKLKVEAKLIQIDDLTINLFSGMKFSEVRTPLGKAAVKEELKYRINQLVPGKPVKDIYFKDFVSQ